MTAPGPATSGIADLDRTLGGLFWGDNVVWEVRRQASVEPFVRALVSAGGQAEAFAHVSLSGQAEAVADGNEVIDASADGPCARPGELLTAVRAFARRAERTILVFDPLDAMAERWGVEIARRFFVRCCPMLLEIGAIAYWSIGSSDALAALRREVEQVTQCVLVVDDHRVRIAKADGRPPGVEGSVLSAQLGDDGEVHLAATPAAARLAVALRSLRERRESQPDRPRAPGRRVAECDLARRARPVRPLARHAARPLGAPQRHARRAAARRRRARLPAGAPTRSERAQQLEPAAAARRPGRGPARVPRTSAGPCLGRARRAPQGRRGRTVARGLVQIELGERRAALRAGEALVAEASSITGWRNVGESEAMLFWILRDPRRAESV